MLKIFSILIEHINAFLTSQVLKKNKITELGTFLVKHGIDIKAEDAKKAIKVYKKALYKKRRLIQKKCLKKLK
jgi:hypothetical protein